MPLQHNDTLRNALCAATIAAFDQGSKHASARIVLLDSRGVICATGVLSYPSMLPPEAGISYPANPIQADTHPRVGAMPVRWEIRNRDDQWVLRGELGPGGEWSHSGKPFAQGEPVTFDGFVYMAAS
jgi:hypothetical protein